MNKTFRHNGDTFLSVNYWAMGVREVETTDRDKPSHRVHIYKNNVTKTPCKVSELLYSLNETRNGTCEVWAKNNSSGDCRFMTF